MRVHAADLVHDGGPRRRHLRAVHPVAVLNSKHEVDCRCDDVHLLDLNEFEDFARRVCDGGGRCGGFRACVARVTGAGGGRC